MIGAHESPLEHVDDGHGKKKRTHFLSCWCSVGMTQGFGNEPSSLKGSQWGWFTGHSLIPCQNPPVIKHHVRFLWQWSVSVSA